MASPLEGQIKKQIAAGFKGKLTTGTIRRQVMALNPYGSPAPVSFTDYPFNGVRESYDSRYRQQALIPETDVKILVLLGSTSIVPQQEDKIFIKGLWHQVRQRPDIDPADATASLQCYVIPSP